MEYHANLCHIYVAVKFPAIMFHHLFSDTFLCLAESNLCCRCLILGFHTYPQHSCVHIEVSNPELELKVSDQIHLLMRACTIRKIVF